MQTAIALICSWCASEITRAGSATERSQNTTDLSLCAVSTRCSSGKTARSRMADVYLYCATLLSRRVSTQHHVRSRDDETRWPPSAKSWICVTAFACSFRCHCIFRVRTSHKRISPSHPPLTRNELSGAALMAATPRSPRWACSMTQRTSPE